MNEQAPTLEIFYTIYLAQFNIDFCSCSCMFGPYLLPRCALSPLHSRHHCEPRPPQTGFYPVGGGEGGGGSLGTGHAQCVGV